MGEEPALGSWNIYFTSGDKKDNANFEVRFFFLFRFLFVLIFCVAISFVLVKQSMYRTFFFFFMVQNHYGIIIILKYNLKNSI